jgi:uncharacterized protein involved in exopolysaccharide biosynthesis
MNPSQSPSGPPEPPRQASSLRVLAEQRSFVLVFVASAALTALALTYVYSERYESYTTISYRVQEVTRFKPLQNEAMGFPAPQAPFKVIGQTLQEVLKSDAILAEVVRDLHLDRKEPAADRPWYGWLRETVREYASDAWKLLKYGRLVEEDPTAAAVRQLRSSVKVTNRDSYVFVLQVRDKYPERAAQIADRLSAVLADWLLEMDRQPGRTRAEELGKLVEEKRQLMDRQRADIESLLRESGVASVQLESDRLTDNLASLRLERLRLSSEIARAEARLASVQSKLARRNAPRAAEEPAVSGYLSPDDFNKLSSQEVFDEIELKSLLAKQSSLDRSIAGIGKRMSALPAVQARLDALRIALAATEREYSLLKDGYQEAAVRASSPVSEVRVLHPAVVPTAPATPIKVYHVLLATVLGLLLSVGLVYLLDFLGMRSLLAPPRGPALVSDGGGGAVDLAVPEARSDG